MLIRVFFRDFFCAFRQGDVFAITMVFAGHFLLTHLLLDNMKKTAHKSKKEGRIVNVSSEAHRITYPEGIRFDKINDETKYSKYQAYGQSKLANILHANKLTR
ncbi:putative very-long-chain 3-oxoacyl-CoA reductase [Helianthus annuus]|nr:putative very-long-chain 3-oxoacyl-CoA reductase [Helianthus annuus]